MGDAVLSTVRNAARLLKEFRSREASIGVSELARRLELGKSGVHRLLTTLVAEGLLERDPHTGGYRLGIVMFELGEAVKVHLDLHAAAGPVLAQLREQTGESSQVGVLDGVEVVYVDRLESAHSLRLFTETGRRVPAHCTSSGKVAARPPVRARARGVPRAAAPPADAAHHRRAGRPARRADDRACAGVAEAVDEREMGVASLVAPDPRRAPRCRRGDSIGGRAGRPLRRGAPAHPHARAGREGRARRSAGGSAGTRSRGCAAVTRDSGDSSQARARVPVSGTLGMTAGGGPATIGPDTPEESTMPVTDARAKARALYDARRTRAPIPPFTDDDPSLGMADGYAIQRELIDAPARRRRPHRRPQGGPDEQADAGDGRRRLHRTTALFLASTIYRDGDTIPAACSSPPRSRPRSSS